VCFKTTSHESKEKELDKLIRQLYNCLVRDPEYISLYLKCLLRFPDVAREIPKPEHWREPLSVAYSYQAVPLVAPTQQHWSMHALTPPQVSAHPPPVASLADLFFCSCLTGCIFYRHQGHQIRVCRATEDYVRSSHTTVIDDHLHLPNFQPIPNNGTRRGIKASLNTWLAVQTMPTPTPTPPAAQTHVVFAQDTQYPDPHSLPPSRIEEIVKTHVLKVREVSDAEEGEETATPHDIFEVFAAEKKRCDSRLSKVPELTAPHKDRYQAANVGSAHTQFKYQLNAKDQLLVSKLEDYLMQGKLSLTTPAHIFAASPIIRKDIVEKLRLRRVENSEQEVIQNSNDNKAQTQLHALTPEHPPAFCLPLQELNVTVNNDIKVTVILDTSSQIMVIQ